MALSVLAVVQADKPATQKEPTTPHTVRLRGAPFNVTEVGADNVTRGRSPGRAGDGGEDSRTLCCMGTSGPVEDLSWKALGSN